MNVALIFAGGVGKRMHSGATPKQFLTLRGKPILAYTLEHFQYSDEIDAIVLVSFEDWIPKCKEILEKYKLTKVCSVVPGGKTGFLSIDNGLKEIHRLFPDDSVVLIHDGVRPLINSQVIADCVKSTKKYGNAITVSPAIETIIIQDKDNNVENIFDRNVCQIAKAPQCFILADILSAHEKAMKENLENVIDSASLMDFYGYKLHTVVGPSDNIKITTPVDFYVFRAFVEARENSEIFGV